MFFEIFDILIKDIVLYLIDLIIFVVNYFEWFRFVSKILSDICKWFSKLVGCIGR